MRPQSTNGRITCCTDQARTNASSCESPRPPKRFDPAVSDREVIMFSRVYRGLPYSNRAPVDVEFFRQQHGESSVDTLTHLRLRNREHHESVTFELYPRIEGRPARGLAVRSAAGRMCKSHLEVPVPGPPWPRPWLSIVSRIERWSADSSRSARK
jgi:hypothetical protein